jgi:hypothetical protein
MPDLEIEEIKKGLPGITPTAAGQLSEACMVCLHRSNHPENVTMTLIGDANKNYNVIWKDSFDEQVDRTYQDQEYTTEHGAICISALLAIKETDYTIIERSRKGTGVDYWLGHEDTIPFIKSARLEVSGVFKGGVTSLEKRFKKKVKQTNQSDSINIPAYISIVEFSTPIAKFALKK